MKIAIASGKGGTGKTSLAVSMLLANAERARLLDCDVEEPNCHLFLRTQVAEVSSVELLVPQVNADLCRLCGRCVRACQFNALAMAGKAGVMVFEELCHSCGGCARACPFGAITERLVKTGDVTQARCESGAELVTGTLVVGRSSAPAVIRAVKKKAALESKPFTLIDSPPGTACTFVAAVDGSNFVLLVTEATPFGLNDLKLAIEALQNMAIPFAIVINRITEIENMVKTYCDRKGFQVWLQIPEDRHIAETYARGGTLLDAMPDMHEKLRQLLDRCAP